MYKKEKQYTIIEKQRIHKIENRHKKKHIKIRRSNKLIRLLLTGIVNYRTSQSFSELVSTVHVGYSES